MAILASLEVDDKGTLIIKDWRQALTEAGEAAKVAGDKSKEGAKGHKEQSDALSRLTEDARKAQQELVRQVQGFQLLANQMKAGTVASQGQIAALQQLQQMTATNTAFTQKYGASLQQTITTLQAGGPVTAQMTTGLNSMAQSLAAGSQASASFAQSMGNAANTARILTAALGALSAGALKSYLDKSFEIASRNQVLSTVMSVVSKNARSTGVEFELQAKKIEALGITTKEARDAVIQFAQAELKVADAAKIARAAQDLAVVAGIDSSAAFQRLTTAIQMTSPMMLRQFGIVKSLDLVYSDYAKSIGKTVSQLDGAQKKQAFMNSILEEAAKVSGAYLGAMEDVGKQIQSLVRLKEELSAKIGEALLPLMLKLVEAFSALLKWLAGISPAWARLATAVMVGVAALLAAAAAITAVTMAASFLAPALAVLMGPWGLLALGIGAVAAAIVYLTSNTEGSYKAIMEQVAATEAEAQGLMDLEKALNKAYTNIIVLNSVTEDGTEGVKHRTAAQEDYEASLRKLEKLYPGIVSGEKEYSKQLDETEANIRKKLASYDAFIEAQTVKMREALAAAQEDRDRGLERAMSFRRALDPKATVEDIIKATEALTIAQTVKAEALVSLTGNRVKAYTNVFKGALSEQDAAIELVITNIRRMGRELESIDPNAILEKAREAKVEIEKLFKDTPGGMDKELKRLKVDPETVKNLDVLIKTFEAAGLTGEMARVAARNVFDEVKRVSANITAAIEEDTKKKTAATEKWKKAEESAYESIANKQATFGANFVGVARALAEVGRGTEEYTARLLRAKGVIEQFNKLTDEQKKAFPGLVKAAKDLEMVNLAQTFEKWNEKLREVVGTVREAASEMGNKFYEETLKRMIDADTKWADQQEQLLRSTAKLQEEIYEKSVVAKMSEVDQKLYADRKYTREFVQRIDDQIKALDRQMAEEQKAITERNAAAEKELAQVIRRAELRFKVEIATVNAIKEAYTDLNEAIAKGMSKEDWEAKIRGIKATFTQEMGTIYDTEMAKINALTASEQAAYNKRYAASREHVTRLQGLQKQVVTAGEKANASIVENHRKATDYVTNFWIDTFQQIVSSFTKGFLQMLTGAKSFTDELIGIWNEMKRAFFKIADDLLQKWISTAFQIAKTGKMMTPTGEQDVSGGFFSRLYKGLASQVAKVFGTTAVVQTASIAPAFAAAPAVQAAATGTTLASTSLAGYAALPGAGAAGAAGGALGAGGGAAGGAGAAAGIGAMGALSAGAGGAAIGGVTGWMVGKSTGSYAKGMGFGAGAGAAGGALIGTMIMPGIGTAIGAGVGALAGLISGWIGASKARKEIEKARTQFIKDVGGIEELKKQAEAAGMSLDKLMNTKNPKEFNAELQKMANALQVHKMITNFEQMAGGAEALAVKAKAAGISLEEMYKAGVGAEELAKAMELISAKLDLAKTKNQMWDLKKQAELVGFEIKRLYDAKTIEDFNAEQAVLNKLLEQQQIRMQGISRAIGGLSQMVTGLEQRIGKTITAMTEALGKEFRDKLEGAYKLAVERGYKGSQLKFLIDIKTNLSKEDQAKLDAMIKNAQKEFNTLGMVAAATFAAIVRETGDVVQAMNAIEEPMARLAQLQEDLGLKADGAFAKLLEFRKVIKDNEDIANSLSGIASILRGLGDASILTQEMFGEMGKSISDMYQTLIDRGVGEQNAMMMSQASLQQLWQLQKDYGFTLDENSQRLVDQAEEQGLVGDKFKDVNQKILDMLIAIGTALGAIIPEYLKVGDAADDLGKRGRDAGEGHRKKWEEADFQVQVYRKDMEGIDLKRLAQQATDVSDAQGDIVDAGDDVGGALDDSIDDFKRWRDEAVDACNDVYEALGAVERGHSPGGLTGVTSQTQIALDAFHDFGVGAGADVEKVEAAVRELANLQHQAVSAGLEGAQQSLYNLGWQQQEAIASWLKTSEGMSQDFIKQGIAAINSRFSFEVGAVRKAEADRKAAALKSATDTLGDIQNQIVESGLHGLKLTLHQLAREEQKVVEQWMETSKGQSQSMINEGLAAITKLYNIKERQAGGPGQREINGEWLDPLYSDWRSAQGLGYYGGLPQFLRDREQYAGAGGGNIEELIQGPGFVGGHSGLKPIQSVGTDVAAGTVTYEDTVPIVVMVDGDVLTRIVVKRTGRVLDQYGV
jgi:hypothetical protein